VAHAHALRAKELARGPEAERAEPVPAEALDRTLRRTALAIRADVPDDPGRVGSRRALEEGIERLAAARDLVPSLELDVRIARGYERLGDVSPRASRGMAYGRACAVLRNAAVRYGPNARASEILARCSGKLRAVEGR
jgi:hypothetical protein